MRRPCWVVPADFLIESGKMLSGDGGIQGNAPLRPQTRCADVSHGRTGLLPIEGHHASLRCSIDLWTTTPLVQSRVVPPSVATPFLLSARGLPVRGSNECLAVSEVQSRLHGSPILCAGLVSVNAAREAIGGIGFACHVEECHLHILLVDKGVHALSQGVHDVFSPDPTVTALSSLRTHSGDAAGHHSSLLTLFRTTAVKQVEGSQRRRWIRAHRILCREVQGFVSR